MADWTKPTYTKGEVDRAGLTLLPWWRNGTKPDDLDLAFIIVENWRSSHSMPLLTFRMSLSNRARRLEQGAIVAQRLKRFSSLMNKLDREPTMKLSQMQDLGGCRAILSNVKAVGRLYDVYRDTIAPLVEPGYGMKCYDYIQKPKLDGYRGIHIVGRYHPRVDTNEPWDGQRIEVQLRSQLQHAFATAVETVTTFTRKPLKFGAGPEEWRRFFSLMGSALAVREGTALVPGTPTDYNELVRELRESTKALKVRQRLRAWTAALKQLPKRDTKGAKWLLLVLDLAANTIKVTGYSDSKKAGEAISALEQPESRKRELDAVLVWVRSAEYLKRAYPNYYADTTGFLEALDAALKGPAPN